MAKTKRYNNFREFYEDEEIPRKKVVSESKKEKNQNLNQYKYMDPKDLDEDDFDDEYEVSDN
jgi:hypothetical protein